MKTSQKLIAAAARLPDETDEPRSLDDAKALAEAVGDGESDDRGAVPEEAEA